MTKNITILDYTRKSADNDKAVYWLHVDIDGEPWMGHWFPDRTGFKNNHYGLDIKRKTDEFGWATKAPLRSKVTSALVIAELMHQIAIRHDSGE